MKEKQYETIKQFEQKIKDYPDDCAVTWRFAKDVLKRLEK